jgi:hypothetical protein
MVKSKLPLTIYLMLITQILYETVINDPSFSTGCQAFVMNKLLLPSK